MGIRLVIGVPFSILFSLIEQQESHMDFKHYAAAAVVLNVLTRDPKEAGYVCVCACGSYICQQTICVTQRCVDFYAVLFLY